jgi:hypothetical protein
MKRLIKKIKVFARLKRKIFADWQPVDVTSPDLVQIITDAMAAQTQIQVEYEGSGWRLILPYGWNTSKDGNVLLMCYKDTGEVRSYRLDRILQVLIDSSMQQIEQQNDVTDTGLEVRDYNSTPSDFEVPLLPNIDEILQESENEPGRELPYDQGLNYLTNEDTDELAPQNLDEELIDNKEDNIDEMSKDIIDEDLEEKEIDDLEKEPEKELEKEKKPKEEEKNER